MYKIALFRGDGIGSEVSEQGVRVIKKLGEAFHLVFEIHEGLIGGASIDKIDHPFGDEAKNLAFDADAVLLGAVGGPKWDHLEHAKRPEMGLLELRRELHAYANLRPIEMFEGLEINSTLKTEIVKEINLLIVRELVGGIYFGTPRGIESLPDGGERGFNTQVYETTEIERIAEKAFQLARHRRRKVTSVDKANILEASQLWRKVVTDVHKRFQDISLEHRYVDECAMQLVKDPKQFDVILTDNMFGDILSDEAAVLTGSIGMLASASIGDHAMIYEPVHGSAPDIMGRNMANPLATILSVSMMMEHSFGLHELADVTRDAVKKVLQEGYRTPDLYTDGFQKVSCSKMGDLIVERIEG